MLNKCLTSVIILLLLIGCKRQDQSVVIYCSLDKIYSEPILDAFEKETGIQVKAVYDTELTKTVGLVNRIIAEASNPRCDVFWNNEISRTILLKNKNLLQAYTSPGTLDIPSKYKDNEGFWTGFAARGRIIIYNKAKLAGDDLPSSIMDLADIKWNGKAAIAYPLFGTTATHAAALFSDFGDEWATSFFNQVLKNEIAILDGNTTVRDQVVAGDYWWGFTDTDDANAAMVDGKNVSIIYPDQGDDEMGLMIIPNTIALIKNCPNPENGKRLIDFVLRREVEEILANSRSAQIPLRSNIKTSGNVIRLDSVKQMEIDFEQVCKRLDYSARVLNEIFVK